MQNVRVKVHENVATVVLDRPESHNALNPQLVADLKQAFSDVHQEKRVGAVVLSAAGDHFCSGVDLKVFSEISQLPGHEAMAQWHTIWKELTELLEQMLRFPKPIVAAVDGKAIGAGLSLVLACDLFVMSDRATLSSNAVQRGLVGGATAALMSFRFGGAIAARMMLSDAEMSAAQADAMGLTSEVVDSSQVWVAANRWAQRCGQAPREALQATKRVLNESVGEALLTQLSAVAADSAAACTTDAANEGIRAFVEGRSANWP
ncbi:enoyl-CoA hydratase/isomerase family protein [Stieleria varia]|nr:enoyl-CoA hydratase/isomerase family protein [Stieleria varia]